MTMRLAGLAALLFSFCASAVPQQEAKHAPTFQECNADLNLWTSQIPGWPNPSDKQLREATKTLTVEEMTRRESALRDCSGAHPVFNKSKCGDWSANFSLIFYYDLEMENRLHDFLDRHNLAVKFLLEDEAGKR